jgi:hypothetical protein
MLWFGKPKCPVLSILVANRGTAGVDKGALLLAKQWLDGGG